MAETTVLQMSLEAKQSDEQIHTQRYLELTEAFTWIRKFKPTPDTTASQVACYFTARFFELMSEDNAHDVQRLLKAFDTVVFFLHLMGSDDEPQARRMLAGCWIECRDKYNL